MHRHIQLDKQTPIETLKKPFIRDGPTAADKVNSFERNTID